MFVEQHEVLGLGEGMVKTIVTSHLMGHYTCALLKVLNPEA